MGVEDRVIFGSTVTIKDIENDEIKKYQIVGDAEADIENNTISFTTPMARALLKKNLVSLSKSNSWWRQRIRNNQH